MEVSLSQNKSTLTNWHPLAKAALALVSLMGAIYFQVIGDSHNAILMLVVLALCI